jgi:hypothetical protein
MWSRASGIVLGVLLIAVGALLLAVNSFGLQLPFDLGRIGWPVFVIAPGVALLIIGLVTSGEAGVGLAVAGAIVSTVGLILAYQSSTGHWSSWAYAWALIAPTSVGAAMLLWGILHRRGGLARQGLSALALGLVIFVVGFAFFEGVLSLGGERGLAPLGRQALPVALIGAGAVIVLSRLWPRRRQMDATHPDWPLPPHTVAASSEIPPWESSSAAPGEPEPRAEG